MDESADVAVTATRDPAQGIDVARAVVFRGPERVAVGVWLLSVRALTCRLRSAVSGTRHAEGPAMDASERFAMALNAARCRGDKDLLPDRLVRAAAVALPADGAGLSGHDAPDFRTPLAGSSEIAATAERLEFTTGCGPCLTATEWELPIFATEGLLARRWPIFHDLLVTRTALRSLLALPLPGRLRGIGAIDLYYRDPAGPLAMDGDEARSVAGLVAEQLGAADWPDTGAPPWLATPAARRRGRGWTAVGMGIAALQVSTPDGLAPLRGAAYATERTVDDLADDLLERRLAPAELRGHSPRPATRRAPQAREARAPMGRSTDRQPVRRPRRGARMVGSVYPDPPAAWDGHVLLLHSSEQERRAGLAAWVGRGLELGEKVICAEWPDGPEEPLFTVLEAAGVDVATAVRDGRLVVVPVQQLCPPQGQHVVVERALAEGFPAVRLTADARAAPSVLSPAGYRDSERRMEELVRTRPVSVMCQYARSTTTGAELEDVVAAHLTGVHQWNLATGGNGDGLVLRGEIDTANADVFAALLSAADRAASRALRLDLTGVSYL